MTVTLHKSITAADGHGILSSLGPYATAAARQAAVVTAADVAACKVCLQTDTGTLWYLSAQAAGVPTWRQFTTAADSGAFAGNFQALVTSVTTTQYLKGETGFSGTAWTDLSGAAHSVGISGAAPSIGTASTGLSGHAGVAANGTSQYGTYTQFEVAPYFVYWVGRLLSTPTVATTSLFADNGGASGVCAFAAADANLYGNNGTVCGPILQTVNQWTRGQLNAAAAGGTNDFLKTGSTTSALVTSSATAGATLRGIFARGGGVGLCNYELLLRMVFNGKPTGAELTALDSAVTSYFGATVLV